MQVTITYINTRRIESISNNYQNNAFDHVQGQERSRWRAVNRSVDTNALYNAVEEIQEVGIQRSKYDCTGRKTCLIRTPSTDSSKIISWMKNMVYLTVNPKREIYLFQKYNLCLELLCISRTCPERWPSAYWDSKTKSTFVSLLASNRLPAYLKDYKV